MAFDRSTSLLAGMPTVDLQAHLSALQQVYLKLGAGATIASASYTQGDGAKTITYRQTDIALVTRQIRELQAQLGIIDLPGRAIPVRF